MSEPTENEPAAPTPAPPTPAPTAMNAPPYPAQPAPMYASAGEQQAAPGQQTNAERFNVLAIVSFVSAFVVSLAAVITGHIALAQIKTSGEKGRGFAIAGLVLGYVGLVAGLISIILFIIFFSVIMANPNNFMMYNR